MEMDPPGQVAEMVDAGWELGSHSKRHVNLRQTRVRLAEDIPGSRLQLEAAFGAPVLSFSHPYGLTSACLRQLVKEAGYTAAIGLGGLLNQTENTRFYLSRIEVRNGTDLNEFGEMLSLAKDDINILVNKELNTSRAR